MFKATHSDPSTLSELLLKLTGNAKNSSTYLIYGDSQGKIKKLSYRYFYEQICLTGSFLKNLNAVEGDRIYVAVSQEESIISLFLCGLYFGYSMVVTDSEATIHEHTLQIRASKPKFIFADSKLAAQLDAAGANSHIIDCKPRQARKSELFNRLLARKGQKAEGERSYPGILKACQPIYLPGQIDDEKEAYVLFTSGTTNNSKAVRISRRNLMCHLRTLTDLFNYDHQSIILNILPLHHTDGLIHGCVTSWVNGGTFVRPLQFEIAKLGELADSVYRWKVTHFITVPTVLAFLMRLCEDYHDTFQTEDFRFLISSAGELHKQLWSNFEERFGVRISNVYGLTESVVGALYCGPSDDLYKRGTIGKPVDCEAKIVSNSGEILEHNMAGELFLKGDNIFDGYLNEDQSAFEAGWFGTGDIVLRDNDRFFHYQGRKKNIIISGGMNIQPEEINNIMREYRGVRDCFTFGLQNETFGETIASMIESSQLSTIDEKRIIEHCRSKLSEYKIPRKICFIQEFPRGPSGKIISHKAKELFTQLQTENKLLYDNEDIGEVVISIAEKVFHAKNLDLDSGKQNIEGWDSLGHLNFVLALEEILDIRIPPAEILSIQSIADAVKLITQGVQH